MSHNTVYGSYKVTNQSSMNQLMSEYGLNKCNFLVVDSVNSHVTYGVHIAVIGVDYPRARGLLPNPSCNQKAQKYPQPLTITYQTKYAGARQGGGRVVG